MKSNVCIADYCGIPLTDLNRCKRKDIAFANCYCINCGYKKAPQTTIEEISAKKGGN